jgi:hypothetical protein
MRIRHLITTSIVCLWISFSTTPLRAVDGLYSLWECLENRTCHNYPAGYQSVRDIDFRNFSIHLGLESRDIRLSGGHYQDDLGRVDLTEVHYLTQPNSTGVEYVLLVLSEGRTNPRWEWIVQVLQFSKQRWSVIQEFSVDLYKTEHPAFAHTFDESTKTLLMQFDHLGDAHECGNATGSCTVKYRWNGIRLGSLPPARD